MHRLAILALTLTALASGNALAGGRAACRIVYAPPLWSVCYAEEVIWSAPPLEVALGAEWRTWPEPQVGLYSLIGLYMPDWWATLEIGRSPGWWRFALGAGIRW